MTKIPKPPIYFPPPMSRPVPHFPFGSLGASMSPREEAEIRRELYRCGLFPGPFSETDINGVIIDSEQMLRNVLLDFPGMDGAIIVEIVTGSGGKIMKFETEQRRTNKGKVQVTITNELIRGEKCFRVTGIENVKKWDDLPAEYTQSGAYFYLDNYNGKKRLRLNSSEGDRSPGCMTASTISVGELVSPEMKGWIIRTLKNGAARLAEINKKIDKLKAEWDGKKEVIEV